MCALFVSNAVQAGLALNDTGLNIPDFEESSSVMEWAPSLKEASLYRKSEFRRTLKKYKQCYAQMEKPVQQSSYNIQIRNESSLFNDHHKPEQLIQFMLFGTKGYLGPKEFSFVYDGELYCMEEDWVGEDIGEIHSMCIGYEHTDVHSLFIEKMIITKSQESTFEAPCYNWLSSTRGDGSSFRMLWVYPPNEKTVRFNKDKKFRFGRPAAPARKVKNPNVVVKTSFVEHCLKFSYDKMTWHKWRRYDTYKHMNDLLKEEHPELEFYFPEKNTIFKKNSASMLLERQEVLEGWVGRLLMTDGASANSIIKVVLCLPPRMVLDWQSPLSSTV